MKEWQAFTPAILSSSKKRSLSDRFFEVLYIPKCEVIVNDCLHLIALCQKRLRDTAVLRDLLLHGFVLCAVGLLAVLQHLNTHGDIILLGTALLDIRKRQRDVTAHGHGTVCQSLRSFRLFGMCGLQLGKARLHLCRARTAAVTLRTFGGKRRLARFDERACGVYWLIALM